MQIAHASERGRRGVCPAKPGPAAAAERLRARRREAFAVLDAIAALLPRASDLDGRGQGVVAVKVLAEAAGSSGKAVDRALRYWREWRVVWMGWRGKGTWELRFEREVVSRLLEAWRSAPTAVRPLVTAHRKEREALAPRAPLVRRSKQIVAAC